ncbi:hypothetical protein LTR05_003700 [Lithohypha guttulata]|uniref:Heterokaryon incompatibility domain-containing protein n=1 Tax=Lithohypha guttulata TaxID=1690604 RepID=A0AAN7T245_9EURO|nr:hypothetical protein LTR05_003700 [Lithohypha guttulata]
MIGSTTLVPYTCLSYTWGPDEPELSMSVIHIDGEPMRVRDNLHDFLICAGSKLKCFKTWWWIDAICIDQENVVEKNDQVQKMGEIYRSAESVISWLSCKSLGEFRNDLELMRQYMNEYRHQYKVKTTQDEEDDWESTSGEEDEGDDILPWQQYFARDENLTIDFIVLLAHAMANNYWKRAWIVQEVRLARKNYVWAGDAEIELQLLNDLHSWARRAVSFCERGGDSHRLRARWADALGYGSLVKYLHSDPRLPGARHHRRLIDLVRDYSGAECSEIHDRVYALRALATEGTDIRIDYAQSCTSLLFECLWAQRVDICLCSASVLMDRLELKEYPDHDMIALLAAKSKIWEPPSPLSQPYFEIKFEGRRLTRSPLSMVPDREISWSLTETTKYCIALACQCSSAYLPKYWIHRAGYVVCLGGRMSCGLNIPSRHLFLDAVGQTDDAYHSGKNAKAPVYTVEFVDSLEGEGIYGASLVLDKVASQQQGQKKPTQSCRLRLTAPALMALMRHRGKVPADCEGGKDIEYRILFDFEPVRHVRSELYLA